VGGCAAEQRTAADDQRILDSESLVHFFRSGGLTDIFDHFDHQLSH
jgi:hypothetical protein